MKSHNTKDKVTLSKMWFQLTTHQKIPIYITALPTNVLHRSAFHLCQIYVGAELKTFLM